MSSISVSEDDFSVLARAANEAAATGNNKQAQALDKLARKANAALSTKSVSHMSPFGNRGKSLTWRDVPSTLLE